MQQATQLLPAPKEGLNIAEKDLVDLLVSVYDTFCSFKGTNYARLRNIWLNLQDDRVNEQNNNNNSIPQRSHML